MIHTFKNVKDVNGKPVCVMDDLREKYPEKFNESGAMDYKWFESEIRPNFNIFVSHSEDSIAFNIMTKPVSEGGDLSRCQHVDLIKVALEMIKYLDSNKPCRENAITITKLEEALMWQDKRTQNRIARGVEGKDVQ